ncbi:MAG: hypothetical protein CM1200mP35_02050 [Chloroflexota bacterium]|nr:MAG: hypothetical protein CM1200mP35_02050 [Chloroflexota bacterium]
MQSYFKVHPRAPIDALSQTGASQLKILFYGYIPAVLPDMLSYSSIGLSVPSGRLLY